MQDHGDIKSWLKGQGLKPNATYGQNFLLDGAVLDDIVEASGAGPKDAVLEVGPGIGNLTERLLGRAKFVLSVEKDPQFLPVLRHLKRRYQNFRFEIGDILSFDFVRALSDLGFDRYLVAANIPYYISGKLLQLFLTARQKPERLTVLLQREVARAAAAGPGDLSVLALSVQLYGEPRLVREVPKEAFYPKPKVDSAVLSVDVFKHPRVAVNERTFFRVVRACFSGKRKQLHNTLKSNLGLGEPAVAEALAKARVAPSARPQELSLEQWAELCRALEPSR